MLRLKNSEFVGSGRAFRETIYDIEHLFEPKRFTQDIDGACLASLIQQGRFTEAGHHYDLSARAESADFGKAIDAVFARQLDVHKGNVVTDALEFPDRLLTGTGDVHLTVMHPQSYHEALGKIRVILDDQYFGCFFSHRPLPADVKNWQYLYHRRGHTATSMLCFAACRKAAAR